MATNVIRVLLIGCGDVALRTARLLHPKVRLYGLTRRVEDGAKLRAHGIVPIIGDLDRHASLDRLRAAPFGVLHFAPPPSDGRDDSRTQRLIAALARARSIPQRFVYISTSGVYGDCAGARVDETRPRRARTPRSRRRVAAEERLRDWAERYGVALSILRAPGIYAETRLPLDRIRQGTPALAAGRRCLYQSRSRRRSRARDGRGAVPGEAQSRLQRERRRRNEDGQLVRRRRRRIPAAAPAARVVGRGRASHRAAPAVVS